MLFRSKAVTELRDRIETTRPLTRVLTIALGCSRLQTSARICRPRSRKRTTLHRERVRQGLTNAYREPSSRSAAAILRTNLLTVFNAILGVALVVVLLVGQWVDALFGFVLVLNTATGTLAEVRAKRALDRLSVLQAPTAHVRREGREADVDVADIVLDDVVRLRSGEQVPADGELLAADGLEIDESILTGESDAEIGRAHV